VAEVSKVLAMSLPHLVFLGWCVAVRIFFPSVVRWIAHDTYFTALLSVGYPLLSTLMWVHARRHPYLHNEKTAPKKKDNVEAVDSTTDSHSDTTTAPSNANLRKRKSTPKSKANSSSMTTTDANSNVPAAYARSNLASTRKGAKLAPSTVNASTPEAAVVYWLRYWHSVSHCV
jgi:hypothetical protein